MRLFIATRQSVARAIASALSSRLHPFDRAEGYFHLAQDKADDYATWTGGHLLELAEPEAYDPEYHHWRFEKLPIIPDEQAWKYVERVKTRDQLAVIRQLLSQADEIIHAGDPDREGQWMVDELLQYLQNTRPVKRLLIQDLNLPALRKSLASLRDNREFIHLSESARARSRVDWLYGINMTRAYTLLGRHSGYEGVLSVGRVQTPVLSLVVKRDEAIEGFKAQHYFEVFAKMVNTQKTNEEFCYTKWRQASDAEQIQSRVVCENCVKKVQGKTGVVLSRRDDVILEPPALPFDLPALQIECGKQFGYSAREVMEICLQLFEKHHLISYPRSDCRYLPEDYFDESSEVLDAVLSTLGNSTEKNHIDLKERIKKSDCWIKQACWDNTKITTHHGIIPTTSHIDMTLLSEQEHHVYVLIASHYVAQFYPDHQYTNSEIILAIEGEEFSVSGKQDDLVDWQVGNIIKCDDVDIKERLTRPLERFTDETFMEAIESLSTQAARAFIIDGLLKRGFLMKGNKSIFSAPIGRDLIRALPEVNQMHMAELWERQLSDIADGKLSYSQFMNEFQDQIIELIENIRHKKVMEVTSADEILGLATEEKFHCPRCQALLVMRKGKRGEFWGCSRYPECKGTVPDCVGSDGNHQPDFVALVGGERSTSSKQKKQDEKKVGKNCPDCGKPLVKRKGKRGVFAGCSGFPVCTHTEPLLKNSVE